ncbi:hypothetical protein RRG08_056054 [Elysia crispata]|uniref:Uncharacterized protein n=1 Tax=Elysia crispata TaxID=231223 RepID=A0AAE1B6X3_9GAST|nr:hypothetical protein RRG08_056054 [Elysia crispata]
MNQVQPSSKEGADSYCDRKSRVRLGTVNRALIGSVSDYVLHPPPVPCNSVSSQRPRPQGQRAEPTPAPSVDVDVSAHDN